MARPAPGSNPQTAYERTDIGLRPVALLALGLVILLIALPGALLIAFPAARLDRPVPPPPAAPEPRLQVDPAADLAELRRRETARLDSYDWVDRERGIVSVPIEEAMRRVAEHGIADWPGPPR
jgi:hypothetical protein